MGVWACMFVCSVFIFVCVCPCVLRERASCLSRWSGQRPPDEGRRWWAEAAVRGAPGHLPSAGPAPHAEIAGRRPP